MGLVGGGLVLESHRGEVRAQNQCHQKPHTNEYKKTGGNKEQLNKEQPRWTIWAPIGFPSWRFICFNVGHLIGFLNLLSFQAFHCFLFRTRIFLLIYLPSSGFYLFLSIWITDSPLNLIWVIWPKNKIWSESLPFLQFQLLFPIHGLSDDQLLPLSSRENMRKLKKKFGTICNYVNFKSLSLYKNLHFMEKKPISKTWWRWWWLC